MTTLARGGDTRATIQSGPMSADASADGPAARAGRRLRRELAARAPGPRGAVLL
jgi:hypothetical protein